MSFLEKATNISSALIPGVKAATAAKKLQDEKFQDPDAYDAYQESSTGDKISNIANNFGGIFNILIFIVAAYLSWTCNSSCYKSMGIVEKVIRAFFAGFFGVVFFFSLLSSHFLKSAMA